jgi:RNA polymerase sigma factor (sigma-70 family)
MPEERIEALVEQFQAGIDREESFRSIYKLYFPRIDNFFQRKGFSPEESRDLTQETFFRITRTLDSFRGESRFEAWLFSVAWHVYNNEVRRRRTEKRDGLEQSLDFEVSGSQPQPLEEAINKERLQALRAALQGFPDQMRRCCKLRYEDGLKYQEIATVMQISIETVKAHLHQARKRLTEKLGEAE